jgi:hypothetical protein
MTTPQKTITFTAQLYPPEIVPEDNSQVFVVLRNKSLNSVTYFAGQFWLNNIFHYDVKDITFWFYSAQFIDAPLILLKLSEDGMVYSEVLDAKKD